MRISVEYDRSVPTKSSQQRWQASALVSVPCSSSGRVLANPQEELHPVDHCVGSTLFATPKSTMLTMLWSFRMASPWWRIPFLDIAISSTYPMYSVSRPGAHDLGPSVYQATGEAREFQGLPLHHHHALPCPFDVQNVLKDGPPYGPSGREFPYWWRIILDCWVSPCFPFKGIIY